MALPTKSVLDGNGALTTVNTLASGRNAAADSAGVALSTEDLAQLAAIVTAVNAVATATGIVPILGRTTREFNTAAGQRTAFAAASTAGLALPALSTSREIRLRATTACFVIFGIGTGIAATVGATSYPVEALLPDVIVIPASATHYAVIRETADGFLSLTPVA